MESSILRQKLNLYFIMGSTNCLNKPEEVLLHAVKGGITMFQYREKGKNALTGMDKRELARSLQKICAMHAVPFIVNDDIDLAVELDADGVHIGQDDTDAGEVRERIGNKILGVSAHTMAEVKKAMKDGADYIGAGPIFPTATKEDAEPVKGTLLIEEIRTAGVTIPVVGIGGITSFNARAVIEAGGDGVSVISAISLSGDPYRAAEELLKSVQ
ncbi:thiamine phosphate synthase [Metabacillus indicus]|uniref:thiamine phosphate synthase n=1 Tax=Metabacillus indicus TaxID=246786 RepID=UPI0004930501|nr:thiamine phosphate synthase [Metabacillus indicus]KEZ50367.1 thiamine-phosphate pyrophosphorylase [Metabacillus indicus LMG 22858]